MTVLGRGIYSLTEAARLADLRPGRVRSWFRLVRKDDSGLPVFQSDYPAIGNDRAISFLDLIEVSIAGRLREATPRPVSLQHIRKVHRKLVQEMGESHPFCTRDIYHYKGRIFFTRQTDSDGTGQVIEALTDQSYINAVIMPLLKKIEYDEATHLAKLWHIAEGVVIDPARCFGKPIVARIGMSTRVLYSSYEANGRDVLRVADWYEIEKSDVEHAVRFETRSVA